MNKKSMLVGAALTGLMSVSAYADHHAAAAGDKATGFKCAQTNTCKGQGACKGDKNECKGKNSCANHAFTSKDEAACKATLAMNTKAGDTETKKQEKAATKTGDEKKH